MVIDNKNTNPISESAIENLFAAEVTSHPIDLIVAPKTRRELTKPIRALFRGRYSLSRRLTLKQARNPPPSAFSREKHHRYDAYASPYSGLDDLRLASSIPSPLSWIDSCMSPVKNQFQLIGRLCFHLSVSMHWRPLPCKHKFILNISCQGVNICIRFDRYARSESLVRIYLPK